jgi:hypothetical protein
VYRECSPMPPGRLENIMTRDEVVDLIFDELRKAEEKHPGWPEDLVYGAAIVSEEAGELTKACYDLHLLRQRFNDKTIATTQARQRVKKEAAHTAAMGIRFLLNLSNGDPWI